MESKDVRWEQRFSNYRKALQQLKEAVELKKTRPFSNLEKQGMIQAFEYTHELAWKTLKDFLKSRGNIQIYGSRDATREAFQLGLLEDGELWMKMLQSRNITSVYDESTAEEMINLISDSYYEAFNKLLIKMNDLQHGETKKCNMD
jgi:nucleotidyltransferase substrate binding protein (TIGR01987 family)